MNSSELRGFLTGLIFGDGHIDEGITKRAFRIKSINKDFIDKIENELNSCTNFSIYIKKTEEHYSGGCNHKDNWELRIKSHPYFMKMYHHFYDDYKHRIASKDALNWITPYGIANWYMSDGYICLVGKTKNEIRGRRMEIATDRYGLQTIESMTKMLKDRFNISTSIIKRGTFYRIRIATNSYEPFIKIIQPYMVKSMQYKMYLGYTHQPKWMSDEMWELQKNLRSAAPLPVNAEGEDIV